MPADPQAAHDPRCRPTHTRGGLRKQEGTTDGHDQHAHSQESFEGARATEGMS